MTVAKIEFLFNLYGFVLLPVNPATQRPGPAPFLYWNLFHIIALRCCFFLFLILFHLLLVVCVTTWPCFGNSPATRKTSLGGLVQVLRPQLQLTCRPYTQPQSQPESRPGCGPSSWWARLLSWLQACVGLKLAPTIDSGDWTLGCQLAASCPQKYATNLLPAFQALGTVHAR